MANKFGYSARHLSGPICAGASQYTGKAGVEMSANMRVHPTKFPASLDARRQSMLLVPPNPHIGKKLPRNDGIVDMDLAARQVSNKSNRAQRAAMRRIASR